MREDWPKVKLGEVLRFTPRPVKVEADRTYREIGIRSHGRGIFHKLPVTGAEIGNKRVFGVEPGDFVLNIVFAWEGAVALATASEAGMIGSHRFPTFRPDPTRLDPRYLLYLFRTEFGLTLLGRVSPGGAGRNRTLNRLVFLGQEIPLPALVDQRRLAIRIEELCASINDARTLRNLAREEAEDLLICMAHRRDLSEAVKQSASWQRIRLGECIRLVDDSHRVAVGRHYPNLGIYSFGRGLFHKPPIDAASTSAVSLRRVKAGQFIYSRLFAFEGAYGIVTIEYDGHFVSGEYPTFECDPGVIRAEFLGAYFKARSVWREVAIGSKGLGHRRQRVQPQQVLNHSLWIPPLAWQDRLAETQVAVEALKRRQARTATELDALLPAILDRAFKGEL